MIKKGYTHLLIADFREKIYNFLSRIHRQFCQKVNKVTASLLNATLQIQKTTSDLLLSFHLNHIFIAAFTTST